MKRVLYVAFFFPPLGGAGVQRSLKFVRYLPALGWQPTVLASRADYWMRDPTLLAEIAPETRVLRAAFWGARFLGGGTAEGRRSHARTRWLRRGARGLLFPDAYVDWVIHAARLARDELHAQPYDAVLTTSSPDSAHLLGRWLRRRLGLPWVADFRDPWTRRLSYAPPTRLHDALQRRLERSCLLEASRVIVTTEETRQDILARCPRVPAAKIAVIPNGYDEEDFVAAQALLSEEGVRSWPPPGGFDVVHAGQLNPERALDPFLAGLRLYQQRPAARGRPARTTFLGAHYDTHEESVRRFGLEQVVEFVPARPHTESVAALLRSKVLLLLEQDSDRGRLVLPAKVFEYLRAGRPILAVVPTAGAAARLVREQNAGIVVEPGDAQAVAEALDRLLNAVNGSTDAPASGSPAADVARFERRGLASALAGVLDAAASR